MIRKIFGGLLLIIGCTFCAAGGCALDSELLTIPMCLILGGVTFGFLGYHVMGIKEW